MKKTAFGLTLTLALLLTVFGIEQMDFAQANFLPILAHSTINVFSPENTTYYTNDLTLNFSVVEDYPGNSVRYSLDGGDWGTVPHFRIVSQESITEESFGKEYNLTRSTIMCDRVFNGLSDGNHSLIVQNGYVDSLYGHFYENSKVAIYLSIDTTLPEIRNLSIRNATYTINDIPLNFTVSKTVSWIGYALDYQQNVTISGCNTTLTGLLEGSHTIIVYANDTVGNMGASQSISFSVAKPQLETFGSAITVVIIAIPMAIVCVALIGLLLYRRHQKILKENEQNLEERAKIE